jgi:hypothetical protein
MSIEKKSASEYARKNLHDRFGRRESECNSPDRLALDYFSKVILLIEPNAIIKLPHHCQDKTHLTGRLTKFMTIDDKILMRGYAALGVDAASEIRAMGQFENEN